MESTKYIGMDVHKDTISVAVMNAAGKVVMESILETKAATILQFIRGLRGNLLPWSLMPPKNPNSFCIPWQQKVNPAMILSTERA
jgi:hypothetical protein